MDAKKDKRKKYGRYLLLGAAAVGIFALSGCGSTTIDLNKYITIEADGYDSIGTAAYYFNMKEFKEDYEGKIKLNEKDREKLASTGTTPAEMTPEELLVFRCVFERLDKTENLSNDDVVTLEWDCDDLMAEEYFNTKLTYSDISYTVSGLKELESFDPFEYVDVSFSGTSPDGTILITPDTTRPEMQYISFTPQKKEGLKTGESVKVTATYSQYGSEENFAQMFGSILGKTEETYTVDVLSKYVTDISEIPDDLYDKMDAQLQDSFRAHAAKWEIPNALQELKPIGNYLLTIKDGMNSGWEVKPNNYLYFVYQVTMDNDDGDPAPFVYYWYGYYTDIMLLEDGTCTVDLSKYTKSESSRDFGFTKGDYLPINDRLYVAGFKDLESFFNQQIVSKIEQYEYTDLLDEQ